MEAGQRRKWIRRGGDVSRLRILNYASSRRIAGTKLRSHGKRAGLLDKEIDIRQEEGDESLAKR